MGFIGNWNELLVSLCCLCLCVTGVCVACVSGMCSDGDWSVLLVYLVCVLLVTEVCFWCLSIAYVSVLLVSRYLCLCCWCLWRMLLLVFLVHVFLVTGVCF